ncbi:conserved hypothetical protein [Tenacibaculum sp. 190130A14a]|uniref:Uncharacterized protein n=1 Tax=Tenacibaculum polynesiense TaxID=3137857 RepID=A0ABP1F2R6_9FLAO
MKKKLLKGIQDFLKNILAKLSEFGKGASYAINH